MKLAVKNIWNNKTKRILVKISLFLLLVFVIVFFFLEFFVKREIKQFLHEQSNGIYAISYDNLKINLYRGNLDISKLKLRKSAANNLNKEYFEAENCSFIGIELFKLIKEKKLIIKKIQFDQPIINLTSSRKDTNQIVSPFSSLKQLNPIFNNYIKSIAVESIELKNASILNKQFLQNVNSKNNKVEFNVGITNFYTDSILIKQAVNFFNADDIFINFENYQKQMSDGVHVLNIDTFTYSLKNKDITGSGFHLSPNMTNAQGKTLYRITIPQITIKSDHLRGILQNDSISIDSLFLQQADITIIPPKNAKGVDLKKLKEFDLYQLVTNDFKQLKIKYLSMTAEKLRIERATNEGESIQEYSQLTVHLDNFELNEDSYDDINNVLYSDELYLHIQHYFLTLNDQIHQFNAKNISVSSKQSYLKADQLKLKPIDSAITSINTVDMECDSIRLHNIDLKKLFHTREMPLQSIITYHPVVTVNQTSKYEKKKLETNSLLYHFIGNYIKGIYANIIAIEQGRFVLNSFKGKRKTGTTAFDFNFKLTDFSLDRISAEKTEKLFFATNIELHFSNYKMKLADQIHRLEIDQLNVSSYNKQASIKNLHLFPDDPSQTNRLLAKYNRTQTYDIRIPFLELKNTNIHQAFFRKKLRINDFLIVEPDIYFEVFSKQKKQLRSTSPREFYELLKLYMEDISIGKIAVSNGKIKLKTHSRKGKTISFNNKFDLTLENFILNDSEIEKKRLLYSDHFELKLKNHLFQLSDNVHYLQASELGISSRKSEIFIKNAILYPNIKSINYGNLPWYLHINIPEINLKGVNLEKAYFENRLIVNQLNINKPRINYYRSNKKAKKFNLKNLQVPLPKEIKLLTINQFNLNNGHIRIFNSEKLQENEILHAEVSMKAKNSSLVSKGDKLPANFESDNISTTLDNLYFSSDNEQTNTTIRQIQFSSKEKNLIISGLNMKNNSQSESKKLIELEIPTVRFEQLNFNELLNKNCILFELIEADNPKIKLKATKNKTDLYQLKIPQNIAPFVCRLAANKLHINNTEITLLKADRTKTIKHVGLTLNEFSIDSLPSGKLLGSEQVRLKLKDYAFTDSINYYTFNLGELSFNSNKNNLLISDIQIDPIYTKEQFQKIIPFQTDHYRGSIASVQFQNIDPLRWLNNHELTGSQIIIKQANISIYRDKNIPFNNAQRSKLPQELIKNFRLPFHFDSLKLENSTIHYSEQVPDMPFPGKVFFEKINATVFPLTNIVSLNQFNSELKLNASALLMGKAALKINMSYDMLAKDQSFHVSGHLASFYLRMINPITQNMAGIAIQSGRVNRFEFEFNANNLQSNGKLKFAYNNLKVSILEYKKGNTRKASFASFLTNNLVLKSKNPRAHILLPSEIHFIRDPKKSVINYWWKSIFSGAKNTMGIKKNK